MAFFQDACSESGASAKLMAAAPRIITRDPQITSQRADGLKPDNSPKTSAPHASPQSLFVLESGIPRPIPMYFAAYCWNKSPITQQNPPANNQNIAGLAALKSANNLCA